MELDEQIYHAAIKVAEADHYMVAMRAPEGASADDWQDAADMVMTDEILGVIETDVASRALIAISEASGYSLMDLGA